MSSLSLLVLLSVFFFLPSEVRALTVDPGGPAKAGWFSSAAIVEGRPAIAYSDDQQLAVKFVRALDAAGKTWGAPVTVDSTPRSGFRVCLRVVNGNPAVCYFDAYNQRIKYARATNAAGSAWGNPVLLNVGGALTTGYSLEVLDGNPAICYDGGNTVLEVVRAADATGTAWGTPVHVDYDGTQSEPCMTIVDGFPAIAYGLFNLRYVRATNAAGTAWSEPVNISPLVPGLTHGISLRVVNGRPAVSFSGAVTPTGDRNLWYTQATDATGTAWITPFMASPQDRDVLQTSLAVVNGRPAIGFYTGGIGDLKYVQALDANGAFPAAWGLPVTADGPGDAGKEPSLLEVNGYPALAYHHGTRGSLEFLRPTDESGGTRWPAAIVIEGQSLLNPVPDGGEMVFGACDVGKKTALKLTIFHANTGSAPLTNISISIDGPDTAELVISKPLPVTTIAPGTRWEFEVEYRPVAAGVKTATVHIASMADGVANPVFDITLRASSLPRMLILDATSNQVTYGEIVYLPLTVPGSANDTIFTIRNPGNADLEVTGITLEGPDAAEFSISPAAGLTVAPGASTAFTLRHATATGGRKSVMLFFSNNLPPEPYPFYFRVNLVPGTMDRGFLPEVLDPVNYLAVQGDGKILAGGDLSLERYTSTGDPDVTFFSPSIFGSVQCIAVQKDGRILIGGGFTRVGGLAVPALARLEKDGSVDPSFVPDMNGVVFSLLVQPDGKILAGGSFTTVGGSPWNRLVRLHPDGSRDTGFVASSSEIVRSLALEPGGKVLAGQRTSFTRFNPDGSSGGSQVDFGGEVLCLAVQGDGNILAGGTAETGGAGASAGRLKRYFPHGVPDTLFHLGADPQPPLEVVPLVNGTCLAAGDFNAFGGFLRRGIACILADGTPDHGFIAEVNDFASLPSVTRTAVQWDGKVLLAGHFQQVDGTNRRNLARLVNEPAFTQLKAAGLTAVRWLRSGTAPEVRDVTFDVKPAGSPDWTRLGTAARISGGWELSGLTLPAGGTLRAQAYAGGSVMESIAPVSTPLELWRWQYFNTPDNTGDAANDTDPDNDGLTNFTEFAFGLNPVDRTSNTLPAFTYAGGSFTATFTFPDGREELLYSAEWSPAMQPGTWEAIPDTGTGGAHRFSVPAGGGRMFTRFTVRIR